MRRPLFHFHVVRQLLIDSNLSFNFVAVVVVEGQGPVDIGECKLRIMSDDFSGCLAAKVVPYMNVPHTNPRTSHTRLAPADGRFALDVLGDDWMVLMNVHASMIARLGRDSQWELIVGTQDLWRTATRLPSRPAGLSSADSQSSQPASGRLSTTVCKHLLRVNTPGCTTADMRLLNFHHRRRPMFPFERGFDWQPTAENYSARSNR